MTMATIWVSDTSSTKLFRSSHVRHNTGRSCAPYSLIFGYFMPGKLLLILLLTSISTLVLAGGTYQEPEDFLSETFAGEPPEPAVVWLTGDRKSAVTEILGHRYTSLRVRYWQVAERSAWILEEVGKDLPITVGIVINASHIERIKVLIFRESRGWEIRHSFFTDQFNDSRLEDGYQLDRQIDGISGATLSVRAMKKLAALALYLDAEIRKQNVTPAS